MWFTIFNKLWVGEFCPFVIPSSLWVLPCSLKSILFPTSGQEIYIFKVVLVPDYAKNSIVLWKKQFFFSTELYHCTTSRGCKIWQPQHCDTACREGFKSGHSQQGKLNCDVYLRKLIFGPVLILKRMFCS